MANRAALAQAHELVVVSPQVVHYHGTAAALRQLGVLPCDFAFPSADDDRNEAEQGWCMKAWVNDGNEFRLRKRAIDGAHHKHGDYRPDHWLLMVRTAAVDT